MRRQNQAIRDSDVDGKLVRDQFAEKHAKAQRHPIQALLTLDWLLKEPDRARSFLSGS